MFIFLNTFKYVSAHETKACGTFDPASPRAPLPRGRETGSAAARTPRACHASAAPLGVAQERALLAAQIFFPVGPRTLFATPLWRHCLHGRWRLLYGRAGIKLACGTFDPASPRAPLPRGRETGSAAARTPRACHASAAPLGVAQERALLAAQIRLTALAI